MTVNYPWLEIVPRLCAMEDDIGDVDAQMAQLDLDDEDADAAEDEAAEESMLSGMQFRYADYKHLPVHEQMAKWQEQLFPPLVDIISGLGGTNLFFISAEALLNHVFTSGELDFAEDVQFLHAIFAMEQVLSDIKCAGGVFRLVFFNSLRTFYQNYPGTVWTLREVFLVHCYVYSNPKVERIFLTSNF